MKVLLTQIKIPVALTLISKVLDINILIFATILVVLGMLIDFLVYLNSSPVELPYEREHFIKSAVKSTICWIGWVCVYWLLFSTLCAVGMYIGLPEFRFIADLAGITLLTTVVLYDLRKLKYTKFYYFKPIKKFIDKVYAILDDVSSQDQQPRRDRVKESKE